MNRRMVFPAVSVAEHVSGQTRYYGQCAHAWSEYDGRGQRCGSCGATCERNQESKIVVFDANVPVEPRRDMGRKRRTSGSREVSR
jgi:hypothetical protein